MKVQITGEFDKKVREDKGKRDECCVLRSSSPNFYLRSMTFGTVSRTLVEKLQASLLPYYRQVARGPRRGTKGVKCPQNESKSPTVHTPVPLFIRARLHDTILISGALRLID